MNPDWKQIDGVESIPSPGLVIDADRLARNIASMLAIVDGDASRLRPHVKTHKMPDVIRRQMDSGINKFKAATLTEAAMVARTGGTDILIAYPVVGTGLQRLSTLIEEFPQTRFAVVVDNLASIAPLADAVSQSESPLRVLIDVDCGMHRTGIPWGDGLDRLRDTIESRTELSFGGLHVYDGHLHQPNLVERKEAVEAIRAQIDQYTQRCGIPDEIVAGGSPTYALWAAEPLVSPSPGTTVFWDIGYGSNFPDLPFEVAAALLTRVISKPCGQRVCLDVGYKSVASEMPLERRVEVPSLDEVHWIGHSEEHLVCETPMADQLTIGQPLFVFPRHICPTVALHDWAHIIHNDSYQGDRWPVVARTRYDDAAT
ncbi:MAG: D-TA family PLP-dependent enzyme [Planctomycetota bacterium]